MIYCEDCIHFDVCDAIEKDGYCDKDCPETCYCFKDKELFVKLPCKVGTPVFIINKKEQIFPGKFRLDDIDQFGKRVFLTRSEAEAALKAE